LIDAFPFQLPFAFYVLLLLDLDGISQNPMISICFSRDERNGSVGPLSVVVELIPKSELILSIQFPVALLCEKG
jgi:hypothetical protein